MDRPNQSQWSVLQCSQPQCTLFSVCLYLYPYFLSVSIFFLIICLSPSLSLLSVCFYLNPHFLSVSIKRWRQTENKDRDGDTEKMRMEMETKKK